MALAPHGSDRADERDADQQIARDLLGPAERVVEHIAREELQKNDEGQDPEQHDDGRVDKTNIVDILVGLGGRQSAIFFGGVVFIWHAISSSENGRT